jgi:uncharacterized protein
MIFGIVSDTHDHIVNTKLALSMLRNLRAECILHAGDFCAPFMVPLFEGWPLHAVFGNNDGDHYRIQHKMQSLEKAYLHGEFMDQEIAGRRIAMYHGTQQGITEALIRSGTYDLVVTGHTHEAVNKSYTHPLYTGEDVVLDDEFFDRYSLKKKTLHINPGSVNGLGGTATFALYDALTGYAEIVGLD